MYNKITVYQLAGMVKGQSTYSHVEYFFDREVAQAAKTDATDPLLQYSVLEMGAFQHVDNPDDVWLVDKPIMVAKDASDLKRKKALAKLTPEERKLLNLEDSCQTPKTAPALTNLQSPKSGSKKK